MTFKPKRATNAELDHLFGVADKAKRGGAREGAGRKTKDNVETKRYQVGLDSATAEAARLLGGGDLSYGLRLKFKTC